MKHLITLISALLFLLVGVSHVWALPNCVGARSIAWQNCFGTYTWSDGENYVGEFGNEKVLAIGNMVPPFMISALSKNIYQKVIKPFRNIC
jgi:hypothetical protein